MEPDIRFYRAYFISSRSPLTKGAEWRFASTIAGRIEALGAITRGDRRASGPADMREFNVDTGYGNDALKLVLTSILNSAKPDYAHCWLLVGPLPLSALHTNALSFVMPPDRRDVRGMERPAFTETDEDYKAFCEEALEGMVACVSFCQIC